MTWTPARRAFILFIWVITHTPRGEQSVAASFFSHNTRVNIYEMRKMLFVDRHMGPWWMRYVSAGSHITHKQQLLSWDLFTNWLKINEPRRHLDSTGQLPIGLWKIRGEFLEFFSADWLGRGRKLWIWNMIRKCKCLFLYACSSRHLARRISYRNLVPVRFTS